MVKCKHKNKELHMHRRKNYPFGRKSKPRYYGVKYVSEHCKSCRKILRKWKVRNPN